jgi:PadR family transcriptional regulator, regulatory protein PadR
MLKKKKDVNAVDPLSPMKESLLTVLYRYGHEGIYNLDLLNNIQAADKTIGRKPMALGTFYPTVKRLEEDGLVSGFWDEQEIAPGVKRRYLRITGAGTKALTINRQYREILSGSSPGLDDQPVPLPGLHPQIGNCEVQYV